IPAAKSIDTHEKNEYSGLVSLAPSLMEPYLLHTKKIRKRTKIVTAHTYTQFKLTNKNCFTVSKECSEISGKKEDTKLTKRIKKRLGNTIPLLNVVLGFILLNLLMVDKIKITPWNNNF